MNGKWMIIAIVLAILINVALFAAACFLVKWIFF